ncbi:MAG TPA: MarR family transcriptional regulator [Ktedonobacteraceae bacterium]|nr:MarR family transcriptional regulator [Ktedonobacteraceae bacterium]
MRKELSTSGLYDHTGYWLRRLSNLVHQTFERALAEHGVTVAQWNVLVAIFHGDAATPFDLARFIDIDTGAVTRLVDRLVEKRLLDRCPDPKDRRSIRLVLTDKGQQLIPQLVQIADENDRQFFGPLTLEEHQQLKALISTLLAAHGLPMPSSQRKRELGS